MITNKLPKICLSLSASDTTIMHRAGMAGLWMTLQKLELKFPSSGSRPGNLSWLLTNSSISLDWQGQDVQVLDWLLKQSFQINEKGIITLTGLDYSSMELISQIHLHEAIGATFLRHNQFYKSGGKASEVLNIDGITGTIDYQKKEWYVHQTFADKLCNETGQLLVDYIQIVSWIYPGATVRHAILEKYTKLEEKVEYALALLFLPLICQYFILDSNPSNYDKEQSIKYVIVIPEVTDLESSSKRCWKLQSLDYKDFYVTNLEEAALKYYSYNELGNSDECQKACQVLLYEKSNKGSKQRSLTDIQDIEVNEQAILNYQSLCQKLQNNEVFYYKKRLIVKVNHIRGIIASNLVKQMPWWSDFWMIFNQSRWEDLHKQLIYNHGGLNSMIKDDKEMEIYKLFIEVFHEALRRIYAKIYAQTEKGLLPRFEREYERIRGELCR